MAEDRDLACVELVELVTDYLEGALPGPQRLRFERHLLECDGCAAYLDQMRRTIELTGGLRVNDLSPAERAALLAAFAGLRADSPG
jgi:anti-sigma factor RsiW